MGPPLPVRLAVQGRAWGGHERPHGERNPRLGCVAHWHSVSAGRASFSLPHRPRRRPGLPSASLQGLTRPTGRASADSRHAGPRARLPACQRGPSRLLFSWVSDKTRLISLLLSLGSWIFLPTQPPSRCRGALRSGQVTFATAQASRTMRPVDRALATSVGGTVKGSSAQIVGYGTALPACPENEQLRCAERVQPLPQANNTLRISLASELQGKQSNNT
jgi:hypothetical protein